jgi:hypothetical protein
MGLQHDEKHRRWVMMRWWSEEKDMKSKKHEPAVTELCSHVFQVVIPHVFDFEHETVLVCICGFSHIGE